MAPALLALLPLVAQLAPSLMRHLVGPRGGAISEEVLTHIRAVAGTTEPAEARAIFEVEPGKVAALQLELAQLEDREETERLRLLLQDRADARRSHAASWVPPILTAALTLGFFWLLWELLGLTTDIPAGTREVLLIVIGVLVSEFRGAVGYWLGTSRGAVEMRQTLEARR